jgi:uncharacterized membrane protein
MQRENQTGSPQPHHASFRGRLKTYFFTGLVISAPIAITIWATYAFVSLFDTWVKPLIPSVYNPDHYLPFSVPGVGLIFTLVFITLIGALAANLVGRTVIAYWDRLLNRMPVIRSVYRGTKQIFQTIVSQQGGTFRQAALVEYPNKGLYTLFLISKEIDGSEIGLEPGRRMYAAFIPTTPNPTSGYLYFFDVEKARILDMSVEDSIKLVISCGLVFPDRPPPLVIDASAAEKLTESKERRHTPAL